MGMRSCRSTILVLDLNSRKSRRASWPSQTPRILSFVISFSNDLLCCLPRISQVGPVPDSAGGEGKYLPGQFIAAGYVGHGMSRAYSWYIVSPM